MRKPNILLAALLMLVLSISTIGCGAPPPSEPGAWPQTPGPTPAAWPQATATPSPTPMPENYREQEAIAAVYAYYYSLAKGPEANYYVRDLIMEYQWQARYEQGDEDQWTVEAYYMEASGLHNVYAWWKVYGSDMSRIDCHEWDASRMKGEIEELSKGY